MEDFQEHIKDQRTSNIKNTKVSYCGEALSNTFHFESIDHAVSSIQSEGRLSPCPLCAAKVIELLKNNSQ